jgi:hypothetical protein
MHGQTKSSALGRIGLLELAARSPGAHVRAARAGGCRRSCDWCICRPIAVSSRLAHPLSGATRAGWRRWWPARAVYATIRLHGGISATAGSRRRLGGFAAPPPGLWVGAAAHLLAHPWRRREATARLDGSSACCATPRRSPRSPQCARPARRCVSDSRDRCRIPKRRPCGHGRPVHPRGLKRRCRAPGR